MRTLFCSAASRRSRSAMRDAGHVSTGRVYVGRFSVPLTSALASCKDGEAPLTAALVWMLALDRQLLFQYRGAKTYSKLFCSGNDALCSLSILSQDVAQLGDLLEEEINVHLLPCNHWQSVHRCSVTVDIVGLLLLGYRQLIGSRVTTWPSGVRCVKKRREETIASHNRLQQWICSASTKSFTS